MTAPAAASMVTEPPRPPEIVLNHPESTRTPAKKSKVVTPLPSMASSSTSESDEETEDERISDVVSEDLKSVASMSLSDIKTIDLGATTCAELTTSSSAGRRFFVIWFDGYLAAKHGTTVSDGDKMQQRLERVLKACEADGSKKVMPLMEKSDAK